MEEKIRNYRGNTSCHLREGCYLRGSGDLNSNKGVPFQDVPSLLNVRYRCGAVLTVLAMILCFFSPAYANNLAIKRVALSGQSGAKMASGDTIAYIQFDISQNNSWRFSPQLYDAAWVFVKYSVNDGPWLHATISAVNLATITGTALAYTLPADKKGVFIYRAAEDSGALSTSGVKFTWNLSVDAVSPLATKVALKVFALEMVRIPQGAFYVGSGGTESGSFTNGSWTSGATIPLKITSENALTLGTSAGNLWGTSTSGNNTIGSAGTLSAAFPKGYNSFYIMKYDLTQGQYRDFLNTLTRDQQNQRAGNGTTLVSGTSSITNRYVMSNTPTLSYRNGIRCDATIHATNPITFYCDLDGDSIPNELDDGEFIACNWLSWPDLAAYADWAGLRPMTELEYEKAARGTAKPVANEYAWGKSDVPITSIIQATGITNPRANNETASNSANCVYGGHAAVQGPLRCGFAATSSSTRYSAGASFYGVMELSGNLWKRPVTVGNATGRLFTSSLHGNGILSPTGNADISTWPGTDATGSGFRGGAWIAGATYARVSDRYIAANTGAVRYADGGARLARTSP